MPVSGIEIARQYGYTGERRVKTALQAPTTLEEPGIDGRLTPRTIDQPVSTIGIAQHAFKMIQIHNPWRIIARDVPRHPCRQAPSPDRHSVRKTIPLKMVVARRLHTAPPRGHQSRSTGSLKILHQTRVALLRCPPRIINEVDRVQELQVGVPDLIHADVHPILDAVQANHRTMLLGHRRSGPLDGAPNLIIADHSGQLGDAVMNLRQPLALDARRGADAEQDHAAQQKLHELQPLVAHQPPGKSGESPVQQSCQKMESAVTRNGVRSNRSHELMRALSAEYGAAPLIRVISNASDDLDRRLRPARGCPDRRNASRRAAEGATDEQHIVSDQHVRAGARCRIEPGEKAACLDLHLILLDTRLMQRPAVGAEAQHQVLRLIVVGDVLVTHLIGQLGSGEELLQPFHSTRHNVKISTDHDVEV